MGRSKMLVDGWCGGRIEKAGDPKVVDDHQGQTVVEWVSTTSLL